MKVAVVAVFKLIALVGALDAQPSLAQQLPQGVALTVASKLAQGQPISWGDLAGRKFFALNVTSTGIWWRTYLDFSGGTPAVTLQGAQYNFCRIGNLEDLKRSLFLRADCPGNIPNVEMRRPGYVSIIPKQGNATIGDSVILDQELERDFDAWRKVQDKFRSDTQHYLSELKEKILAQQTASAQGIQASDAQTKAEAEARAKAKAEQKSAASTASAAGPPPAAPSAAAQVQPIPGATVPALPLQEAFGLWSSAFYGVVLYDVIKCKTTGFNPSSLQLIRDSEKRLREAAGPLITKVSEDTIRSKAEADASLKKAGRDGEAAMEKGANCTVASKGYEKTAVQIIETQAKQGTSVAGATAPAPAPISPPSPPASAVAPAPPLSSPASAAAPIVQDQNPIRALGQALQQALQPQPRGGPAPSQAATTQTQPPLAKPIDDTALISTAFDYLGGNEDIKKIAGANRVAAIIPPIELQSAYVISRLFWMYDQRGTIAPIPADKERKFGENKEKYNVVFLAYLESIEDLLTDSYNAQTDLDKKLWREKAFGDSYGQRVCRRSETRLYPLVRAARFGTIPGVGGYAYLYKMDGLMQPGYGTWYDARMLESLRYIDPELCRIETGDVVKKLGVNLKELAPVVPNELHPLTKLLDNTLKTNPGAMLAAASKASHEVLLRVVSDARAKAIAKAGADARAKAQADARAKVQAEADAQAEAKRQAEAREKEKLDLSSWVNYQKREKTLLEKIFNYSSEGIEEGNNHQYWISGYNGNNKCVLSRFGAWGGVPFDLRTINMRGFRIEKESFVNLQNSLRERWRFGDEKLRFNAFDEGQVMERLERAWGLAFRECPGVKTEF